MESKRVVMLDSNEQFEARDCLSQIALAFPDRDEEGSEDSLGWKQLKRLSQHDAELDAETLTVIKEVLERAADRLVAYSDETVWSPPGGAALATVPGSASPASVLAETARIGLVNLERLGELVKQASALVTLG